MRRMVLKNRNIVRSMVLAAAATATLSTAADAQTWIGPAAGSWSVGANWAGGAAPNSGAATALVDNGNVQNTNVTMNGNFTVGTLIISSGDQVTQVNNTGFTLGALLQNAGTYTIAAGANLTDFSLGGTVNHTGGGMFVFGGANARMLGGGTFVNGATNTMFGFGQIGVNNLSLSNAGNIIASGGQLTLDPSNTAFGVTNTGTISALATGSIVLTGSAGGGFNNAGGTISANGGDVFLVTSAAVNGGTLRTTGGSAIRSAASNTVSLTGVTNTGSYIAENNSQTNIGGSFTNSGIFTIAAGPNLTDVALSGGSINFNGAGTILLTGGNGRILGSGTLNNTNNTIRGRGNVGVNSISFINAASGVVRADDPTGPLLLDVVNAPGAGANAGLMVASGGGELQFTGGGGGDFVQSTGIIRAENASKVSLFTSASITGGTLTTLGTGSIHVNGASNVFLANLTTSGNVVVENNSFLNFSGTINNTGSVNVVSTVNATDFDIVGGGTVTLTGGGAVNMSGVGARMLGSGTLVTNNVIRGTGQLGVNSIAIINTGLVSADVNNGTQAFDLSIDPANTPIGFTNNGTLQATAGGRLVLTGGGAGAFDNTNGRIIAQNNSNVHLTTSVGITGGTISTVGSGTIEIPASVTVGLASLTLAGNVQQQNNSLLNLAGTINNTGSITINAGANASDIQATSSTVTLTGGGTINMSSTTAASQARMYGSAATTVIENINNKIVGQGNIGANQVTFINQAAGLINANVSGKDLVLDPGNVANAFINNGSMQASNGGRLVFTGGGAGAFVNNATITAQTGSNLHLTTSVSITGGTLNSVGTGTIEIPPSVTVNLGTMTLAGNVQVANNSLLNLAGTINNTGSITLTPLANLTDMQGVSATLTLTGGGTINMSSGTTTTSNARFYAASATNVIDNINNKIVGQGNLGANQMTFINQAAGLIDANVAGKDLVIDPGNAANAFTNNGSMQASNGGRLVLTGGGGGGFFNNTTITAKAGSNVHLTQSAGITGGTFSTVGTGTIEIPASVNVFLANVTNAGNMQIANNSLVDISGTFTNIGSVNVNGTPNLTDVRASGSTLTLNGGGSINMNSASGRFYGVAASTVIDNVNNKIHGQGNLGANQMTFNNKPAGIIDADIAGTDLTIDPGNVANAFVNTGTMRASTGRLVLTGNGGGPFVSTAGAVDIQPAGTFHTTTSASFTAGTVALNGTWEAVASSSSAVTNVRGTGSLNVSGSALVKINAGGGTVGTSKVTALSLTTSGSLDITNHDFVIDYTGASPTAGLRPLVQTAFNGGAWNGAGLTSSTATAASSTPDKTGVGYAEATEILGGSPTSFGGVTVDATSTLVRYTLAGDANLDRTVDISDFARLAANFNVASLWYNGDFNYSGTTEIGDFALLASNFNKVLAADLPADLPRGSAVPEPAAIGALLLLGGAMKRTRRN